MKDISDKPSDKHTNYTRYTVKDIKILEKRLRDIQSNLEKFENTKAFLESEIQAKSGIDKYNVIQQLVITKEEIEECLNERIICEQRLHELKEEQSSNQSQENRESVDPTVKDEEPKNNQDQSSNENATKDEKENNEHKSGSSESQSEQDNRKQELKRNLESRSGYKDYYNRYRDFGGKHNVQQPVDRKSNEAIKIESLFKDSDSVNESIKTTLLYVATFFEQLSVQEFNRVVTFLLEPQIVTIKVPTKLHNEKGEEQIVEVLQACQLADILSADPQKQSLLMKECYLEASRLKDARKVINFSLPHLRKDAKNVFEKDYAPYLEKQFKRVRFLLLDSSDAIVFNVINISSEMAVSDPDIHAYSWLKCLYRVVEKYESIYKNLSYLDLTEHQKYLEWEESKLDSDEKEELILFNSVLNLSDWEMKKEFVLWQLSTLIAKMLEYPQVQDEVNRFLDWAINEGDKDVVLEVIIPLDSVPNFDQIYWIQQLLDRSNEESVLFKAQIFLLFKLAESGGSVYKYLQNIYKWLPKKNLNPDKFSSKYALQFIFDYSREMIDILELEDYGHWPSKYNLFVFPKSLSIDSNLEMLIDWIFHPSLKYILNRGVTIEYLASNLLKDWFNILWGFRKDDIPDEAVQISKKLLGKVVAVTNRTQQNELVTFWKRMEDDLLKDANKLSEQSNGKFNSEAEKNRKRFMQERTNIRCLKSQFKELQKTKS